MGRLIPRHIRKQPHSISKVGTNQINDGGQNTIVTPRKTSLVKSRRTVREDMGKRLYIATKRASVTDAFAPSFQIVETWQGVYPGVKSKF